MKEKNSRVTFSRPDKILENFRLTVVTEILFLDNFHLYGIALATWRCMVLPWQHGGVWYYLGNMEAYSITLATWRCMVLPWQDGGVYLPISLHDMQPSNGSCDHTMGEVGKVM